MGTSKQGWFTKAQVSVMQKGVSFEVSSCFGHQSASESSNECYRRLIKTLSDIEMRNSKEALGEKQA